MTYTNKSTVVCRFLIGTIACWLLLATAWAQRESVEEMLLRRTAALRSQVVALDTQISDLNQRVPNVEAEIERLEQKAKEITVPDPEEETEEPPKRKPRKVAFRPPFEREVEKQTPIAIICQNNRISLLDIQESDESFRSLVDDEKKLEQLVETKNATLPAGDFQILVRLEVIGSQVFLSQTLLPIPGRNGESESSVLRSGSNLLRRLDGLDAKEDLIQFAVYPDSFDVFRAVRQELWKREFGIQWSPIPHGEKVGIGDGPITQQ